MYYALLTYKENKGCFNIGDYIQSLAAKQFLPKVDLFLNREKLAEYTGDPVKLIMNGWFTHNIHNWVPSEKIIPLFVSFHLNHSAAPFLLSEKGIEYLKRHEPIGCRDQFTVDLLISKGIKAYFTGCLTLTLDSYKLTDFQRENKIYIVDPLYNYPSWKKISCSNKGILRSIQDGAIFKLGKKNKHIKNIISDEILNTAIFIDQEPPSNRYNDEEKFAMAGDLLKKYAKAKLVITSRIHCALPCLALGTPVVYIHGFDNIIDSCRFDGILNLFNCINVNTNTGDFKANFLLRGKIDNDLKIQNLEKQHDLVNHLKDKCRAFVSS
jgi:hypothetical protein